MANYTEAELDRIEATVGDLNVIPREREAGRKFLLLNEADRSYPAVAQMLTKSDGGHPTDARTAVYVRNYLRAIDKLDESPRRGAGNGGSRAISSGSGIVDNTVAQREQYLHEQDRIVTQVNDANSAVEEFNADDYKVEVANELREKLEELTIRLTAWEADENNVATDSANSTLEDLTARAAKLSTESADKLEFLTKQIEMAEQMLRLAISMDADALAKIKAQNAEFGAELEALIAPAKDEEPANTES